MKRYHFIIYILVLSLGMVRPVQAQYAHVSMQSSAYSSLHILQVDQNERFTRLYLETSQAKQVFPESLALRSPDGKATARLRNAYRIPLSNEAETAVLYTLGDSIPYQFAWEFDPLPNISAFDVVDLAEPETTLCSKVTVDTQLKTALRDEHTLTTLPPVDILGSYFENEKLAFYIQGYDILIRMKPTFVNEYGSLLNINFTIQNYSNHSVLFDPSRISVEAVKVREQTGKKQNNFQLDLQASDSPFEYVVTRVLNRQEYDSSVANQQALGSALERASTVLLRPRNPFNEYYFYDRDRERFEIRQHLYNGYATKNTIFPQSEYSGYVRIEYKDFTRVRIVIPIGGVNYEFPIQRVK